MSPHVLNVCFHGIGEPERELEPGEDRYWVTRGFFLSMLDSLVGRSNVAISFDDGNASDHSIALPGLIERGLEATFFALAGRLEAPGSLGPDELVDLCSHGMSIGTHGMDHRPWPGLSQADRHRELVEARSLLGAAAGAEVNEAALPLGRYNRQLLRELRRLGYTRVHTSDWRLATEGRWLQPRFTAQAGHTVETFWSDIRARSAGPLRIRQEVVGILKRLR